LSVEEAGEYCSAIRKGRGEGAREEEKERAKRETNET
jgi:hypothetical protein